MVGGFAADRLRRAWSRSASRRFVNTKIHAGEPLWGNYPPGEELEADHRRGRSPAACRRRRSYPHGAERLPQMRHRPRVPLPKADKVGHHWAHHPPTTV
jgi:hypothetical protein